MQTLFRPSARGNDDAPAACAQPPRGSLRCLARSAAWAASDAPEHPSHWVCEQRFCCAQRASQAAQRACGLKRGLGVGSQGNGASRWLSAPHRCASRPAPSKDHDPSSYDLISGRGFEEGLPAVELSFLDCHRCRWSVNSVASSTSAPCSAFPLCGRSAVRVEEVQRSGNRILLLHLGDRLPPLCPSPPFRRRDDRWLSGNRARRSSQQHSRLIPKGPILNRSLPQQRQIGSTKRR